MNYWPRWINAITNATATLSLVQMGAYDRLLDHAYKTEKPLPADVDECCRIVRATSKAERDAVQSVLVKFWQLGDGGYTQDRVTDEIALALPKIEAARTNGKAGGRPKGTHKKPSGFPAGTQDEPKAKAPHPQSTSSPTSKKQRGDTPLKPPAAWSPPEWVPVEQWASFVEHRKAMRGIPFTDAAKDGVVGELRKLCDAGHDAASLLSTAVTHGWRTVYPPKVNGAAGGTGAMSPHGLQTMRNAQALEARLFSEDTTHEA